MRISDWSSDVCSSDLHAAVDVALPLAVGAVARGAILLEHLRAAPRIIAELGFLQLDEARALQLGVGRRALGQPVEIGLEVGIDLVTERRGLARGGILRVHRSEEHTSELQSLMRYSY